MLSRRNISGELHQSVIRMMVEGKRNFRIAITASEVSALHKHPISFDWTNRFGSVIRESENDKLICILLFSIT